MKNLEVILIALPSAAMFGFTMYMKNIHDGASAEQAVARGWTYGIVAAGFFVLVYILKFIAAGT